MNEKSGAELAADEFLNDYLGGGWNKSAIEKLTAIITKHLPAESAAVPSMELATLVRELLDMLETTEQSDMGRTFHPTTIQTCRCADAAKLDELMPKLKAASRKEGGK